MKKLITVIALFITLSAQAQAPPSYVVIEMEFYLNVYQDNLGRGSDGLVHALMDSVGREYMLLIENAADTAALDYSDEVLPAGWLRFPPANRPTFTGGPVAGQIAYFCFDVNGNMYIAERRFVGTQ